MPKVRDTKGRGGYSDLPSQAVSRPLTSFVRALRVLREEISFWLSPATDIQNPSRPDAGSAAAPGRLFIADPSTAMKKTFAFLCALRVLK